MPGTQGISGRIPSTGGLPGFFKGKKGPPRPGEVLLLFLILVVIGEVGAVVVLKAQIGVKGLPVLPIQGVRQGAVGGDVAAHSGQHRQLPPDVAGGLGPFVAHPAALVKDQVHEEAGGHVGTLPYKVVAQGLLGRVVGPDEVTGGIVVVKALFRGGVQIHPQLLVGGVAVPQPGLVVAVDDHHHRPLLGGELVQQPPELIGRILDGAQVVVHNVGGFGGIPAVGEVDAPPDALGVIGAVALIGDIEGEIGLPCPVPVGLVELEDLRHQNLVPGDAGLGQLPVVVFLVVVGGQTQIAVDV